MRTIKQQRRNDCGIACLAMLGGSSYNQAYSALYGDTLRAARVRTPEIRSALIRLGRQFAAGRKRPLRNSSMPVLQEDALVSAMIKIDGEEYRHWVVWDGSAQEVRDPFPTENKLRLLSYLPITAT